VRTESVSRKVTAVSSWTMKYCLVGQDSNLEIKHLFLPPPSSSSRKRCTPDIKPVTFRAQLCHKSFSTSIYLHNTLTYISIITSRRPQSEGAGRA
jgi:hypothetical protein